MLVESLLRGKTEEQMFSIVHGLFEAHDKAKSEDDKDKIFNLASMIMSIGETNKGIDWS